jgi:hypothetical protein
MSSMSNANSLAAAFVDLATYTELESRLYGNRPKSADNFLPYTSEKFKFQKPTRAPSPVTESLKKTVIFITAIGFIINYAYKYNLTYFEPCDLLQRIFLISAILTLFFIIF